MRARLLPLFAILSACSSGPGGPSADQACSDFAAAVCNKVDQCTKNGIVIRYGDSATCVNREKMSCLNSLMAKGTGNNPSHEESCAMSYGQLSCADYFAGNLTTACDPPTGPGAAGSACEYRAQCQSGWCNLVQGTLCGTCGDEPKPGDSCATNYCGRGQYCESSTMTCQTYGAQSGTCDRTHLCNPTLTCVIPMGMTSGTCQPLAATVGATCDTKDQSAPRCDGHLGLFCEPASSPMTPNMCAAMSYVSPGQPCAYSLAGTYAECTAGSQCVGAMGGTQGTCVAPAAEGAACDTANGPPCMAPARCVITGAGTAGTCVFPGSMSCG